MTAALSALDPSAVLRRTSLIASVWASSFIVLASSTAASTVDELVFRTNELREQIEKLQGRIDSLSAEIELSPRVRSSGRGFSVDDRNGGSRLDVILRGQIDFGRYSDVERRNFPNAGSYTGVRKAQFGVAGGIGDQIEYEIVAEIVDGPSPRWEIDDAVISLRLVDDLWLNAGNFKSPVSIEDSTANPDRLFLEPPAGVSLSTFLAEPTAALALGYLRYGDDWRVSASVSHARNPIDGANDQIDFNARVIYLPLRTPRRLLHFGVAGLYLVDPNKGGDDFLRPGVRLRGRSEQSLDVIRRLDTGFIETDRAVLFAAEAAVRWSRLTLIAEAQNFRLKREPQKDWGAHQAYYVAAAWLLTGEVRPYSLPRGAFTFISPTASKGEPLPGAWEIAARYSRLRLRLRCDAACGTQSVTTLGLNWYVSENIRLTFSASNVSLRLEPDASKAFRSYVWRSSFSL
jgi:phosphate-selective porin OprO/OprP